MNCYYRAMLGLFQRGRAVEKYHHETMHRLKTFATSRSMVTWLDMIQSGVSLYHTSAFDEQLRHSLAHKCFHALQRVICIVTTHLGLRIKESEFRGFVFGLTFLMRSGVCMQGVDIPPRYAELSDVLPSEAFMTESRLFRAKLQTLKPVLNLCSDTRPRRVCKHFSTTVCLSRDVKSNSTRRVCMIQSPNADTLRFKPNHYTTHDLQATRRLQ